MLDKLCHAIHIYVSTRKYFSSRCESGGFDSSNPMLMPNLISISCHVEHIRAVPRSSFAGNWLSYQAYVCVVLLCLVRRLSGWSCSPGIWIFRAQRPLWLHHTAARFMRSSVRGTNARRHFFVSEIMCIIHT